MSPINPFLFLDVETGGFDLKRQPLLEIGWLWTDHAFEPVDHGTIKIEPPKGCLVKASKDDIIPDDAWYMSQEAINVNGYDPEIWAAEGAKGYADAIAQFTDYMAGRPIGRVFAHNATTEDRWLARHTPAFHARVGRWECTMAAMRQYWRDRGVTKPAGPVANPDGTTTPGQLSLAGACKVAGYFQREAHGALPDCFAAAAVAKFLKLYKPAP